MKNMTQMTIMTLRGKFNRKIQRLNCQQIPAWLMHVGRITMNLQTEKQVRHQ